MPTLFAKLLPSTPKLPYPEMLLMLTALITQPLLCATHSSKGRALTNEETVRGTIIVVSIMLAVCICSCAAKCLFGPAPTHPSEELYSAGFIKHLKKSGALRTTSV